MPFTLHFSICDGKLRPAKMLR